jgi:hypothetical protein
VLRLLLVRSLGRLAPFFLSLKEKQRELRASLSARMTLILPERWTALTSLQISPQTTVLFLVDSAIRSLETAIEETLNSEVSAGEGSSFELFSSGVFTEPTEDPDDTMRNATIAALAAPIVNKFWNEQRAVVFRIDNSLLDDDVDFCDGATSFPRMTSTVSRRAYMLFADSLVLVKEIYNSATRTTSRYRQRISLGDSILQPARWRKQ